MKNVQDIYPLSPMQEYMLLHAVSRGQADMLVDQFCFHVSEAVDEAAYAAAWRALLARHAILRTAFVWERVKQPMQIVRARLDLPFERLDWSELSETVQQERLAALRREDLEQGFDPRRAPLLRVKLVRLGEQRYVGLWSSHHLLLDRWCITPLLEELRILYGAHRDGASTRLPGVAQFGDYIGWLKRQDVAAAEVFWGARLAGLPGGQALTEAKRGTPDAAGTSTAEADESAVLISGARHDGLRDLARASGTTLGTAVQIAWALTVNRCTGQGRPVFGLVVSGRPTDLPGVETIFGSFINNVPVAPALEASMTLAGALKGLQASQLASRPFEYLSPARVAALARLPAGEVLFDHLLVWLAREERLREGALTMHFETGEPRTAYPLTVAVAEESDGLALRLRLLPGHRARVPLDTLARTVLDVVDAMIHLGGAGGLADLAGFTPAAPAAPAVLKAPGVEAGGTVATLGRVAGEHFMIEETLAAYWQDALGHAVEDREVSVFELGATSLDAATVHRRIEIGLRVEIPILALFRDPCIAGMARTLAAQDWPLKDGTCFCLREQGEDSPLFCIASPEVDTLGFALLTRHLPEGRPVYLVQSPPDGDAIRRVGPRELPALCQEYVAAIRVVQPQGPYRLLGTCTGAQMAVEIARQLTEVDARTDYIGIVHTWGFYTVSRRRELFRWLDRAKYLRGRVIERLRPGDAGASAGRGDAVADTGRDGGLARELADDSESTRQWLEDFGRPDNDPGLPRLPGPLVLLRLPRDSEQRHWRVRDRLMGWGRQCEDVRVELLEGDRVDAIFSEPSVAGLARAVHRTLPAGAGPEESDG